MSANVKQQAPKHRSALALTLVAASLTLAGCGGGMDDLERYVDQVKSQPGQRPEPLPEIKPYETFTYQADVDGLRSPFRPDTPSAAQGGGGDGPRPDDDRTPEYLEQFPLDSFDMVGTLAIGGATYGLVRAQDGLVHRVLPGNYIGQSDGRITSISESEIAVTELVSNGIGGYIERDVAIALDN